MRKEVGVYIVFLLLFVSVFLLAFFQKIEFTGQAVLDQYENQTSCEASGYTWENLTEEECTNETVYINETVDCEPCLEYEDINGTQGECISWTSCVNETSAEEETCVDVVVGGQCVGDVCSPENLNLCSTSQECGDAGGYWYDLNDDGDQTCNENEEISCSDDLNLCLTEDDCTSEGGGYWYEGVCNENECSSDAQCTSGYVCSSGNCLEEEGEEETTITGGVVEEEETNAQVPVQPAQTQKIELNNLDISPINLNPGQPQQLTFKVTNTGTRLVSACQVNSPGDFSDWVSFSGNPADLNVGESKDFPFNLNVPENTESGAYNLQLGIECLETSAVKTLSVNVVEVTFEFNITDIRKIRNDEVRVRYILSDISGEDQNINLNFVLLDKANQKISEVSYSQNLGANETDSFSKDLTVNENVEGNLTFHAEINSRDYSSSVDEAIVLSTSPILGFAIFDQVRTTGGVIMFLIVIAVVLILVIFIARRLRKHGLESKNK